MCHFMADIYMTDGLNVYVIRQKKIELMKMRNQIKDFNQNYDTFLCKELLEICACVYIGYCIRVCVRLRKNQVSLILPTNAHRSNAILM